MSYRTVSESEFSEKLRIAVNAFKGTAKAVTGPGRSGAIASVYASHELGIPYLPPYSVVPSKLRPLLVIDTAHWTGKTIKRLRRKMMAELMLCIYNEPPMVRFWYERKR